MTKKPRTLNPNQKRLVALTLDPGFSAFGWGIIIREAGVESVSEMDVIRTKKASKKKRILANEDNFMRGREISEQLITLIRHYGVNIMTFEAFSVPQKANKSNLIKIGMPYGMLIAISVAFGLPVVMSTPQHIKKSLCGRIGASKDDVEVAVKKIFRKDPGVRTFIREVPESVQNHGWDALAAYVAAKDSDVMIALKKLL